MAGIFSGDNIAFLEDAQRPQRDVLQVANGSGDQVESPGREWWKALFHFVYFGQRLLFVKKRIGQPAQGLEN